MQIYDCVLIFTTKTSSAVKENYIWLPGFILTMDHSFSEYIWTPASIIFQWEQLTKELCMKQVLSAVILSFSF